MVISSAALPNDIEALKRLLRARDAELAQARAEASNAEALIAHLRLSIEKMRREVYGQRSERSARLLDQMELELEELEAAASEDELAAERVAAAAGCAFRRSRPLIPTDRDQLFRSIATSGRGCVRAPLDAFSDVSVGVPRQAWDWSLRSAPGSSVSALPAWILRIDGPSSARR